MLTKKNVLRLSLLAGLTLLISGCHYHHYGSYAYGPSYGAYGHGSHGHGHGHGHHKRKHHYRGW